LAAPLLRVTNVAVRCNLPKTVLPTLNSVAKTFFIVQEAKGKAMKALIAAVVSGLIVFGAASSASAHSPPGQERYAPGPGYYVGPGAYVAPDPGWRARREWRREEQWRRAEWERRQEWRRREEWRHQQWLREQWRRDKWRHHRGGWDN
jgi:hypothetical protein